MGIVVYIQIGENFVENGEHLMLEILILAMNGGQDILKDKSVKND